MRKLFVDESRLDSHLGSNRSEHRLPEIVGLGDEDKLVVRIVQLSINLLVILVLEG